VQFAEKDRKADSQHKHHSHYHARGGFVHQNLHPADNQGNPTLWRVEEDYPFVHGFHADNDITVRGQDVSFPERSSTET